MRLETDIKHVILLTDLAVFNNHNNNLISKNKLKQKI